MERKCLQCDGELIKRKFESKKRFSKKKFCSTKCSRAYLKANKMGWWAPENKRDNMPEDYSWL